MRRTEINKKANREIAKQIEEIGIDYCELNLPGCNGLFIAASHRHERKWFYDKPVEWLWNRKYWATGCYKCHSKVDKNKKLREETFLELRGEE